MDSRIGWFNEFVSKKGKHYFKGNMMLGGVIHEVLLFESGNFGKRKIYAMLSSSKINFG
jgi:hypothetical protein